MGGAYRATTIPKLVSPPKPKLKKMDPIEI